MERQLLSLDEWRKANDFLRLHDWLFVSPLFFQGGELMRIAKLSEVGANQKEEINRIIFTKFYDLGWTASFIEGYCNRSTYISPFLSSIEHSLILIFQRDYEGGIKTLIPIIEGILRRYLCLDHLMEMEKIRFSHLKKAFEHLKDDLLSQAKTSLLNRTDENKRPVDFSATQIEILYDLHKRYDEGWFSFIIEFINKSLYLSTTPNVIPAGINRHAILHELGFDIKYTLENYIKIYFALYYLTWIFLRKEGKSLLNQIEDARFLEKVEAYKRIIGSADQLTYEKHILYKNYPGYDEDLLKGSMYMRPVDIAPAILKIYNLMKRIDKRRWRRRV
jgi:hypothetical protein